MSGYIFVHCLLAHLKVDRIFLYFSLAMSVLSSNDVYFVFYRILSLIWWKPTSSLCRKIHVPRMLVSLVCWWWLLYIPMIWYLITLSLFYECFRVCYSITFFCGNLFKKFWICALSWFTSNLCSSHVFLHLCIIFYGLWFIFVSFCIPFNLQIDVAKKCFINWFCIHFTCRFVQKIKFDTILDEPSQLVIGRF